MIFNHHHHNCSRFAKSRLRAYSVRPEVVRTSYRWRILVMSYACMLSLALAFQSIPPILRLVISDLNITHAQACLLMSLFALPGAFIAIPSGMVSDRFDIKKVCITSLILIIVGTFFIGLGENFLIIGLGRTVSGIGAMILSIALPRTLSQWFSGK